MDQVEELKELIAGVQKIMRAGEGELKILEYVATQSKAHPKNPYFLIFELGYLLGGIKGMVGEIKYSTEEDTKAIESLVSKIAKMIKE